MTTLAHFCPHCLTARSRFDIVEQSRPPPNFHPDNYAIAHLLCGTCGLPAAALLHRASGTVSDIKQLATDPLKTGWQLQDFWPVASKGDAPPYVPPSIQTLLIEAERAEKAGINNAAAMAYGKSLDLAIKHISPDLKGMLHSRIEQLKANGKLLPAIADWTMQLKGIRNDAMHEDEPFAVKDVQILGEATRLIMTYLFTIEGHLEALKTKKDSA
jgi:hypothetical protein